MQKAMIATISLAVSAFSLYTAIFGRFTAILQRGIFLGMIMVLALLMKPAKENAPKWTRVIDYIGVVATIICTIYMVNTFHSYADRIGIVNNTDTILGLAIIIILLELCRRVVGIPLTVVCLCFLGYAFYGNIVPGYFGHMGYSINRIVSMMYLTTNGIYGSAMSAAATFVAIFIVFGAFLEKTGGSKAFIDFTTAIVGNRRGGPAKVAVLASALTGTISGSAVANVTTTGTFTIPLMKKIGYRAKIAGAVEAVASSGGAILPPVMGSAAFVMSEMTGIPYSQIALASTIPAIIYYFAIYFVVDFEAAKHKIGQLGAKDIPEFKSTIKQSLMFFIPLGTLLFSLIVLKLTIIKSAMYAITSIIIASFFTEKNKITPKVAFEILVDAAKKMVLVTIACASAGIVVGVVTLTGLGLKLSGTLLLLGKSSLLLTLVICMFGAIVISMGLPATPGYIVFSVLAAPALIKLGVPALAAHLFIFYYACFAPMTPPVAISSYAAAGISGSNPIETALQAFRYVIPAFIIPYFFIYAPEIMAQGPVLSILLAALTGIIGVFAISAANVGWLIDKLKWYERTFMVLVGLMLIIPEVITDVLGVSSLAVFILIKRYARNK